MSASRRALHQPQVHEAPIHNPHRPPLHASSIRLNCPAPHLRSVQGRNSFSQPSGPFRLTKQSTEAMGLPYMQQWPPAASHSPSRGIILDAVIVLDVVVGWRVEAPRVAETRLQSTLAQRCPRTSALLEVQASRSTPPLSLQAADPSSPENHEMDRLDGLS